LRVVIVTVAGFSSDASGAVDSGSDDSGVAGASFAAGVEPHAVSDKTIIIVRNKVSNFCIINILLFGF